MNIPRIGANQIRIDRVDILPVRSVLNDVPPIQTYAPPVTVEIGNPIIDMPGCVEAHESNNPLNENIDDSRGILTYCDGNVPSFNPPDYSGLEELDTPTQEVDTKFEEPKESNTNTNTNTDRKDNSSPPPLECPTAVQRAQEPVGTYINGYREQVTEYKLIDGVCVQITETVGIPEQVLAGLPSGGQVMQVGGIAVIATTSALLAKPLADILLKVVKPTVKKVIKKIAKIRGKQLRILSVEERREEQRDRNQAIAKLKSVKAKTKK
jgi:hypothetical protein